MLDINNTNNVGTFADQDAVEAKELQICTASGLVRAEGEPQLWEAASRGWPTTFHSPRHTDPNVVGNRLNGMQFTTFVTKVCSCNSHPCSCFICEEAGHA
jgi:hypothetical protein